MSTVLTLALDPKSQLVFEKLRREYYPPALNRIPAHVSLFHQLPGDEDTHIALANVAASTPSFEAQVTGVRSLGKGVAYTLASDALAQLQARLATLFAASLIPQDKQPFRPHVVVQNKVPPEEAKKLLEFLSGSFQPWRVRAVGLDWWDYLGGTWQLRERFRFG